MCKYEPYYKHDIQENELGSQFGLVDVNSALYTPILSLPLANDTVIRLRRLTALELLLPLLLLLLLLMLLLLLLL